MRRRRLIGRWPRGLTKTWGMRGQYGADFCREVPFCLLPKMVSSAVFNHLRPIAFQSASAREWSRLVCRRLEAFDDRVNPVSMGFKRMQSAHEVALIFRLLRDRFLGSAGFCSVRVDFAAAYQSMVHIASKMQCLHMAFRSARLSGPGAASYCRAMDGRARLL